MQRKINWDRAACKGIDTEIFYKDRLGLKMEGMSYRTLRRICFNCPIQEDCLKNAVENEQYGFQGGLSEDERRLLYMGKRPKFYRELCVDLANMDISILDIEKTIRSVKRNFGYSGGTFQ